MSTRFWIVAVATACGMFACTTQQDLGARVGDSGVDPGSGDAGAESSDGGGPSTDDAPSALDGTRCVLFGGVSPSTSKPLGDTWVFDGASWSQVNAVGPSERSLAGMAFLNGRAVLFGGGTQASDGGSIVFADTWTFDGAHWTQLDTPHAPSGRSGFSMTTLNRSIVLFGGVDSSGKHLDDTWTFDGTDWTHVDAPGPSARFSFAMATLHGKAVLFGGVGATGAAGLDDTWTFDGASWTHESASGPPARFLASMASVGGSIVLYGGRAQAPLDDSWKFDGATWTKLTIAPPEGSPVGATSPADSVGGKMILFGTAFDRTWAFDGTTWATLAFDAAPIVPSARDFGAMAILP